VLGVQSAESSVEQIARIITEQLIIRAWERLTAAIDASTDEKHFSNSACAIAR
jgi:hypothetical protein